MPWKIAYQKEEIGSLSALGDLGSLSIFFRDFLVSLDKSCFCILRVVHPSHKDNYPLVVSFDFELLGRNPSVPML